MLRDSVLHMGRDRIEDVSCHEPICLHLAKRLRQHLVGDLTEMLLELAVSGRPLAKKLPEEEYLPFPSDDIHSEGHRTLEFTIFYFKVKISTLVILYWLHRYIFS